MTKVYQLIQYFQHHQNHLREKFQSSCILLTIILFIFCSQISGYLCNYNSDIWYEYFVVVERSATLFLLMSFTKHAEKICWIGTELIKCFLIQDIIDRLFFDIKHITTNDYITIGVLITIAIIKFKNKNNDNTRTNKSFK